MKLRNKILIPPAAFVSLLFVILLVFFVVQKKQQDLLFSITFDLQHASALSSELIVYYLNNKNHLLLYRYDKDAMHLAHIKLMDDRKQKKLDALKKKQFSVKGGLEFNSLLEHHVTVTGIQNELIAAIQAGDETHVDRVLNRYFIKINQMEAILSDFSVHRFHDLNSALMTFQEGSGLYEPVVILITVLSLLLLLSIFLFYKKEVLQPIFELTDSVWKVAQGYLEFKPKPIDRADEIGQLNLAFCVMTDNLVSANEELEKKVIARTNELERSNNELENFAYVASHDLQEPLRMIASYNQLLAKRYQGQLDEKAQKYIAYAVDGAKRMQNMIHGLLEYSRAGAGEPELKLTNLTHHLDLVLHDLQPIITETGTRIKKTKLPSLMVNSLQISRVFQNLISNAIKFHDGDAPEIDISVKESEGEAVFCIQDNGVGVDHDAFERIFNLFERAHSRQKFSGNGIGLAVSKKLIENHGGRIWLESEKDMGTAFYFSIPNNPVEVNP